MYQVPGSSIDGQEKVARAPGLASGSLVRPMTGWKVSFAVVPMSAFSSSAEPMPGTWIRMRFLPLALDRRLAGADLVDPAADDLERLLDRSVVGPRPRSARKVSR